MSRREWDKRYDQSEKGKARHKRHERNRKAGDKESRVPGPAGSPGPVGAAAQRERRARPEYRLARKLGVSVKVAREMMNG